MQKSINTLKENKRLDPHIAYQLMLIATDMSAGVTVIFKKQFEKPANSSDFLTRI